VAIIIGSLSAFGQYLRFKHTPIEQIKKQLLLPSIVTIVISAVLFVFVGVGYTQKGPGFVGALYVGILASVYTVVANFHYWLGVLKGKLKSAGASVGHIGFGLVLLGIFLSASNKTVISFNTTGINVLKEDADMRKSPVGNPRENITLFEGINTDMGKYMVEYTRDTTDELNKRFFELRFTDKKTNEQFFLYPDILKNNKGAEGFSANPDAKHYWLKDIFVYITSFQDHSEEDTVTFKPAKIKIGDSIFYSNGYIKLNEVLVNPNPNRAAGTNELILDLQVTSKEGLQYSSKPGILLEGLNMEQRLDTIKAQNLVLSFNKVVSQEEGVLEIGIKESSSLTNLITLKVYEFPFINVLWLGVVVMTIGFMMSMLQRIRKNKAI
jgi:cytochrome c-type biogenesis protein CcmF